MIKEIQLKRFKKFKNTTIKIAPFSILMGENSSGKTTIIQAINLALNIFSRFDLIHETTKGFKIRDKGVGFTELPGLGLADFRELYYSKISRGGKVKTIGDGQIGTVITLIDEKENKFKLQISSLFGGYNVKCISTALDIQNEPELHLRKPLYISGFVGLKTSEERSFPVAIQDRLLTGQASSIIRNLILDTKTKTPSNFEMLKKRLKQDFNFSIDQINFEEAKDLYVNAKYAETHDETRISLDFNASGSGFMQILQILTPIYRYCPEESNLVLLDEPDAHLHPNLQASLAKTLREVQKELNIQIIISTHSTTIIRLAEPSEVIPISSSSSNNGPLSRMEDVENEISTKIDTYSLGKSVISGKLLFIEDAKIDILEAFEKVSKKMIFNGPRTIPILKGRGKDDKIPFHISSVIEKFTERKIEIFFIRDGDSLSEQWKQDLLKYAESKNVTLIMLERHEIENYILDPSFILNAINQKYPGQTVVTLEIITEKIRNFLENTIQLNKYQFDDNLEDSIYKTALVTGKSEYRNPQLSKSEAISIRERYSSLSDFQDLIKFGMGKETLSQLLSFLDSEGLQISKKELISSIDFIPEEIEEIFKKLVSNEEIKQPELFPDLNFENYDENDSEDSQ